jgi:hypothetical protein
MKTMKAIYGVVQRQRFGDDSEPKSYWTQIGIAFENRDSSWNLRFDYLPTDLANTTIQLRDFKRAAAEAEAAPAESAV